MSSDATSMRELLENDDPAVVRGAAQALGALRDPAALPALVELLEDATARCLARAGLTPEDVDGIVVGSAFIEAAQQGTEALGAKVASIAAALTRPEKSSS